MKHFVCLWERKRRADNVTCAGLQPADVPTPEPQQLLALMC